MRNIIITIMLIYIAFTNCALEDCSGEELAQIADKAFKAVNWEQGTPMMFPRDIKSFLKSDAEGEYYDRQDLIDYINFLPKYRQEGVKEVIESLLLSFKKLHVYPIYEIFSYLEKDDLINLCQSVEKLARTKHLIIKGLSNSIHESENPSNKEILELLKSFAKRWNISNQELWNVAAKSNIFVLSNAKSNFDKNIDYDLTYCTELLSAAIKKILKEDPNMLSIPHESKYVNYWEILANSQNLTDKELINELHSLAKTLTK